MREFNTSGPCDPELHYTVMREKLVAEGMAKVRQGRFFMICAPRQSGKSTYFQFLIRELESGPVKPVHIRFASLGNMTREEFYWMLDYKLKTELAKHEINVDCQIEDSGDIEIFFSKILKEHSSHLLLVIDEFEGIPKCVLGEFMHAFRDMYHQKENHGLTSMILVGVSTIAEMVYSSPSPFNVADELQVPYFTREEVNDLIDQYVEESGREFHLDVRRSIYENTKGQPGLVCALCLHLVEKVAVDSNSSICMKDFYTCLEYFITSKFDKNIINIVKKAFERKEFMVKLLFAGEPVKFTVDHPDIAYLYANGVVDNVNGTVEIPVPLYAKRLLAAFRPIVNGEYQHYVANIHENFNDYKKEDGLDIGGVLSRYAEYVKRRGFRAFDTENLKESAWHYSLDGYINFFIQSVGGDTLIEVPSGRGRTDILILYGDKRYIIETKIFTDITGFEDGKMQLAQYLDTEGLDRGFYVVFSRMHGKDDELRFDETVEGKRIYTFIIPTRFPQASRSGAEKRRRKRR